MGQRTLAQGSYGLDAPDVYYPDFFEGTWRVTSKAIEVSAPCGAPLFGGKASLAAARAELEAAPVVYEARWIRDGRGRLIADRPYNIASIAAATMGGADALQQLPSSDAFDPNGLIFKLRPEGSDVTYRAELRALARRFEPSAGELRDGAWPPGLRRRRALAPVDIAPGQGARAAAVGQRHRDHQPLHADQKWPHHVHATHVDVARRHGGHCGAKGAGR